MKLAPTHSHRPAQAGFAWALASLIIGNAFATNPARSPAAAAPKTHVLFMGADIAVEKDKAYHQVEDVTWSALVIRPDGKTVNVPLADNVNLRINEKLKITGTSAEIDQLKFERDYSPGTDPFQKSCGRRPWPLGTRRSPTSPRASP